MGREYQRLLGPASCLTSGQFTKVGGSTAICCKRCGEVSVLTQRVIHGGMVSGVWDCPRCPERDFITLCDYFEPVAE